MSEADIGSCLCVSENTCKCTFTTLEPKNLADCCGQCFPLLMLVSLMLSATWCHLFSPFLPLEWSQPCVPSSSCGWESGLSLLPCPSRGQRKVPSRQGQLCLFSVVDCHWSHWSTEIYSHQICHWGDDLWGKVEQGAGVSCTLSALSTTCQRSSKLAVVHTSGSAEDLLSLLCSLWH